MSIITICYNAKTEIERTMLSILNQTYLYIEYIVIDGGSKDGTVDVINRYKDRLSYFVSEPDKGIYDAMNKGVKVATGEWVLFINGGDALLCNDTLETFFASYEDKGEALITGNIRFLKNGMYLDKTPHILEQSLFEAMPMYHPSTFIRREVHAIILYDTKYRLSADYNFFLALLIKGYRYKYIPQIIAMFDYSQGASTDNLGKALLENISIVSSYGASKVVVNQYKKKLTQYRIRKILYLIPAVKRMRDKRIIKKEGWQQLS